MKLSNPVTFYTVPSVWVNEWSSKTTEPYDRIVGIENEFETLWSVEYINGDPRVAYSRQKVKKVDLKLPPDLQKRLFSFFERYFAVIPEEKDKYNCHRFAYWMIGRKDASNLRRPRAPYPSLKNKSLVKSGIKLGETGVWILDGNKKKSVHSVLGLGKDNDTFLQVLAYKGYLALADKKSLKNYFEAEFKGPVNLYV
ncbi:MAG TPA: hypothetical protein VGF75_03715 [Candidatus Saccharimonadales bacterium]|jgi:hypothetical protein